MGQRVIIIVFFFILALFLNKLLQSKFRLFILAKDYFLSVLLAFAIIFCCLLGAFLFLNSFDLNLIDTIYCVVEGFLE